MWVCTCGCVRVGAYMWVCTVWVCTCGCVHVGDDACIKPIEFVNSGLGMHADLLTVFNCNNITSLVPSPILDAILFGLFVKWQLEVGWERN